LKGKGSALNRRDRPREAIEAFERVLALDPDDSAALKGRGWARDKLRRKA
jgi:Flp pilus assembly protein TadD